MADMLPDSQPKSIQAPAPQPPKISEAVKAIALPRAGRDPAWPRRPSVSDPVRIALLFARTPESGFGRGS
jgi:hypothetical protein